MHSKCYKLCAFQAHMDPYLRFIEASQEINYQCNHVERICTVKIMIQLCNEARANIIFKPRKKSLISGDSPHNSYHSLRMQIHMQY